MGDAASKARQGDGPGAQDRRSIVPQLQLVFGAGGGQWLPLLAEAAAGRNNAAGSAIPGRQFVQYVEHLRQRLARGFDRLLALDELDIALLDHQRRAVLRVLRDMRGRALLADDVGLGKTIEAGLIAKEYIVRGLARSLLVLVPAPLTDQWRQELEGKLRLPCRIFRAGDRWHDDERWIASLDTARRPEHAKVLQSMEWDVVIVDEAHRLKNRRTHSWRFVDGLHKKYMLLLTATPIQNDLEELYNMLTLLQPGVLDTYETFKREHVAPGRGAKHAAKLRRRIADAMVRTTRQDAGLPLPRRLVHAVSVPMHDEERTFYDDVVAFARAAYRRGRRKNDRAPDLGGFAPSVQAAGRGLNVLPLILLLRQLCSSPHALARTLRTLARSDPLTRDERRRAAQLAHIADDLGQRSSKLDAVSRWIGAAAEPVVVFTEFRGTQDALARRLGPQLPVSLFHGELTAEGRQTAVEAFRRHGGVLISTEAGGEGQNWQFCRIVVNYDLPWNPMRVEQRIGRVHRLGQTDDVLVVNALAPDTMEMHVFWLLHEKINLFEQVIGDLDEILTPGRREALLPGSAFEHVLGTIFLEASGEEHLRARLEDLGREVEQRMARRSGMSGEHGRWRSLEATPVEKSKPSGQRAIRSPRSPFAPVSAILVHPLSVDVQFARDVLEGGAGSHPAARKLIRTTAALAFHGGRMREVKRRLVHQGQWLFCFRVSYRSDETRETLHVVSVDGWQERPRFLPSMDDWRDAPVMAPRGMRRPLGVEMGGATSRGDDFYDYAVRRLYRVAQDHVARHVREKEGLEHLAEAEARFARDKLRLAAFYDQLHEEALLPVVQQLRQLQTIRTRHHWQRFVVVDERPCAPEGPGPTVQGAQLAQLQRHTERAIAGLDAEQRRRLAELALKYSVCADIDLVGAAYAIGPRIELTYKLLAPVRRDVVFFYDPLTGQIFDLDCDQCAAPLDAVNVGPDGELLCGPCRFRARGLKGRTSRPDAEPV